ncbi:MAG: hypothetical protein QOK28_1638 [Actinomycetota bacterium]|jgi:hypothetical protein
MNRRASLMKRYGPLIAVVAAQVLIIATVPSTAQKATSLATGNFGNGASSGGAGSQGGGTLETTPNGDVIGGSGGGNGSAAGGGGGAGGGSSAASGDTSHCVNGREFDPAIAYWAPPCTPGTLGATNVNNGGATYQGVTKDTITIVDYLTNYGAEVNAILQAQGTLETYDQGVVLDKAFQNFINSKYVLYGRKVKIIPYQGKCQSVPPDKKCLIPEMDQIIASYHPYIVMWNTTLCSECFAEIAHNKTVAVGGIGFSDDFAQANEPYYYASGESSTHIQQAFAEWWCKSMSSKANPARKVEFAAHNNAAQDFNGKPRVLGVISTNDPDNENTVKKVLYKELDKCGDTDHSHQYFYDQNINTAATQTQAGIAAMDTTTNPATAVLCLCDSVAPQFLFQGEENNNYWPENVVADVQGMGNDNAAQTYDGSLACPHNGSGCSYDDAIGLVDSEPDRPPAQLAGPKIYKLGGGQGDAPTTPYNTTSLAKIWIMIANVLENTGPNLTPANMMSRAPALGSVGGGSTGLPLLRFSNHNWNWTQDARIVYWNAHKQSVYNGKPGAYVDLSPSRFNIGDYPSEPNGPAAPPVDQRK